MKKPENDSPFTQPREAHQTPYWLRNGLGDRAESDRLEAEHRRRLGMTEAVHRTPLPTDPAGSTAPASDQTPADSRGAVE